MGDGPFAAAAQRRGTPADLLVVGLANPGDRYAGSRHNIGGEVLDALVDRHGARLQGSAGVPATSDEVVLDGRRLALVRPSTFYNEVGGAVAPMVKRYGITEPDRVVVVHDELDLEPGRLKVKVGGGLAGNNGLRSLRDHLHSTDFVRVRVGIGKPPDPARGADHVLGRPSRRDRLELDLAVDDAVDAIEVILAGGPERAMERFNRR
ncbi:MAG: aminoacyl-tRNA hydrolase [Actinomycetota bacterium]